MSARSWMGLRVLVIGALAMWLAGAAAAEEPVSGPEIRSDQAYALMARGERSWRAGEADSAIDDYETALGLWEGLEMDYPGWHSHVVQNRILYCESAIAQIRDGRKEPLPWPDGAPVAKEADPPPPGSLLPPSAEDSATASRAMRAGIAERDATVAELRAENRKQAAEIRSLTAQLAKAEARHGVAEDAPALAAAARAEARRLIAAGEWDKAAVLLEEAAGWFPREKGFPHLLGISYCRAGRYEEAIRQLDPLTSWGSGTADVWLALGVAHLGTDNLGRARDAFEKALARDPSLGEAHFNLAAILLRLRKPDPERAGAHYVQARNLGVDRDIALEDELRRAMLWARAQAIK